MPWACVGGAFLLLISTRFHSFLGLYSCSCGEIRADGSVINSHTADNWYDANGGKDKILGNDDDVYINLLEKTRTRLG